MEASIISRPSPNFIPTLYLSKNDHAVLNCPHYLVESFLSDKLSYKIKDKLISLFNDYYKTALSNRQLKDVFANVITQAMDRAEILAPILNQIRRNSFIKF